MLNAAWQDAQGYRSSKTFRVKIKSDCVGKWHRAELLDIQQCVSWKVLLYLKVSVDFDFSFVTTGVYDSEVDSCVNYDRLLFNDGQGEFLGFKNKIVFLGHFRVLFKTDDLTAFLRIKLEWVLLVLVLDLLERDHVTFKLIGKIKSQVEHSKLLTLNLTNKLLRLENLLLYLVNFFF